MPGGLGRSQTALLGLLVVAHQYCILVLLSFILSRSTRILIDKTMQICRKTGSQAPKSTAAQDGPKPRSGSGGLSDFSPSAVKDVEASVAGALECSSGHIQAWQARVGWQCKMVPSSLTLAPNGWRGNQASAILQGFRQNDRWEGGSNLPGGTAGGQGFRDTNGS